MADHHLPAHLRYTPEHGWLAPAAGGTGGAAGTAGTALRMGLTAYAQAALGDIVHAFLPRPGARVGAGQVCGEVESVKTVSDLYAPVTGVVAARNEALEGSPELVNADCYGDGWLLELTPDDPGEVSGLLDAAAYAALLR